MTTLVRANLLELQIPDGWSDDTVFTFRAPDQEEKMSLSTEYRLQETTLEAELLLKTRTVREGVPGVDLVETGDILFSGLPGRYFLIRGIRGDEVPFVYFGVLAKPSPLVVLLFTYEGLAERWPAAERSVREVLKTAHFIER
jgi:hypothetical protein